MCTVLASLKHRQSLVQNGGERTIQLVPCPASSSFSSSGSSKASFAAVVPPGGFHGCSATSFKRWEEWNPKVVQEVTLEMLV